MGNAGVQRLAGRQRERFKMAVGHAIKAALQRESALGVNGEADVGGDAGARGKFAADQTAGERKKRMGEPMQGQRALADIAHDGRRCEGASVEGDAAR